VTFADPHRLATLWRTTIVDERIKQLEAKREKTNQGEIT